MQTGVFNFFSNLKTINVVINDVLQAKFHQSAEDAGRFALNTTLGLGGFLDVGKNVGLEQNEEDFEQTLAVWGVPQGSYLVLPLLGPSTVRGIPGAVFDTAANPASYVGMPIQLVSMLNTRASADGSLKFINEAALDPYVFTRESFLQWRNNLATDGKTETSLDLGVELDSDEDSVAKDNNPAIGKKAAPALHSNAEPK
jgi:phospholipid-binding lipoprotein MlaA